MWITQAYPHAKRDFGKDNKRLCGYVNKRRKNMLIARTHKVGLAKNVEKCTKKIEKRACKSMGDLVY